MGKQCLAVIGAGPAGYVAAIRASQLGAEVVLIEKDRLGGTCTNRGCIPTKALLSIALSIRRLNELRSKGVVSGSFNIDYSKVFAGRDAVVNRLVRGIEYLLRKNGVKLIRGKARIVDKYVVEIEESGELVRCDKLVIATGSSPSIVKVPGIDEVNAVSGDDFITMNEVPSKLLVIGGGAVGVELAQIFRAFGSEVHVVEMMPHILPAMDGEVALTLQKVLSRDGISIHVNTVVSRFERVSDGVVAHLSNGSKVMVDRVVVAVGRRPNTSGLGLEGVGIALGRRGEVLVNERMETNVPNIYAAGDVVGKYFLAYTAFEEGVVAAENALGLNSVVNYSALPIAIFTEPEVASVGLTEEDARKLGDVKVGKFPFIANGRALTLGTYEGFVKVIADSSGRILGAHIVGPEASELIHEIALVMRRGGTLHDLRDMLYVHPTLSEAVKEAALSALGRAIHI